MIGRLQPGFLPWPGSPSTSSRIQAARQTQAHDVLLRNPEKGRPPKTTLVPSARVSAQSRPRLFPMPKVAPGLRYTVGYLMRGDKRSGKDRCSRRAEEGNLSREMSAQARPDRHSGLTPSD